MSSYRACSGVFSSYSRGSSFFGRKGRGRRGGGAFSANVAVGCRMVVYHRVCVNLVVFTVRWAVTEYLFLCPWFRRLAQKNSNIVQTARVRGGPFAVVIGAIPSLFFGRVVSCRVLSVHEGRGPCPPGASDCSPRRSRGGDRARGGTGKRVGEREREILLKCIVFFLDFLYFCINDKQTVLCNNDSTKGLCLFQRQKTRKKIKKGRKC